MRVFSATAIQISGVRTPSISSVTMDCFTAAESSIAPMPLSSPGPRTAEIDLRNLMRRGDDQNLLERGNAIANAVERHHAQGPHSLANGHLSHLASIGAGNNQLANFIGDSHRLDNRKTARVAGVLATIAAAATIERHPIHDARVDGEVL